MRPRHVRPCVAARCPGARARRSAVAPRADGARPARPSVLLVTIDTLRADRVGAYGGPPGLTPALDALAARGSCSRRRWLRCRSRCPSHATILTGLEPPRHGVHDNGTLRACPPTLETLATRLQGRGYATGAFVGAYVLDRRFGLARGFDLYDDRIDAASDGRERARVGAARRGRGRGGARPGSPARPAPFFAWVHLYDAARALRSAAAVSRGAHRPALRRRGRLRRRLRGPAARGRARREADPAAARGRASAITASRSASTAS